MADSFGFILSDISRLLRRRFDERSRGLGVTRPQWRTLLILSRHEGINQGGLAELLEIEPITVCRMIDRLAESGLVERRPDPRDRRAWRIHLTEKARPILDELRHLGDGLMEEALAGLAPDERKELFRALEQVRENLNSDTQEVRAHG